MTSNPLRHPRDRRIPGRGAVRPRPLRRHGDLARKKLMPAIYDLANRGLLPPGFALVGFAGGTGPTRTSPRLVHDAVKEHARTPFREDVWERLAEGIRFVPGEFDDDGPSTDLSEVAHSTGARYRREPRFLPVHAAECSRRCSSNSRDPG